MSRVIKYVLPATFVAATALLATCTVQAQRPAHRPNKVAGMWEPVTIQAMKDAHTTEPYGPHPVGLLSFGENLHFVEVLLDPAVPRFAASTRQEATGEEAKAAISGSLGVYGTYTVNTTGRFTGDTVSGSTFPNWKGDVRDSAHLKEEVEGDTMTETFQDGNSIIHIIWRRVK